MSFANLARNIGRQDITETPSEVVDIITFIESAWGLNMRLFPVQKVVLKTHYGLPLDTNPEGFDLYRPIPLDHPNYADLIDTEPRSAYTKLNVFDCGEIPNGAVITLLDHKGDHTSLVLGVDWFKGSGEQDTITSIVAAINAIPNGGFEADGFYGANQIQITSKAFSSEGNVARVDLTPCEGLQVAFPELEIDQPGFLTRGHHFYGGTGGFYRHRVPITDWRRENLKVYTEAEYLKHLYSVGRSNVAEVIPGKERREMLLSIGRRSGKTLISSCIAAYETYKLIHKQHPQGYYGLPDSNVIQIISVATDKDQAGLLYREVHGHFTACDYFATYMANATQTFATFQTPRDISKFGSFKDNPKARFSLKITFRSCVAKGLRGAGNIVVILDEVAHFTDKGQSGAEEVYNAVTPSTSAFSKKDPKDKRRPIGPVEGRIILISSPLGRQGHFFHLFQIGMRGGRPAENILCIEAPTWEVNPTVPASEFEKHYAKDPAVFFTEYGGQFSDRTRGWLDGTKDLSECIDVNLRPKYRGAPLAPHFMGIDLALVGDYCALSIGHLNPQGEVVVDLMVRIKAGEGDFAHLERLEFDGVADWVLDWSKKFYIAEGIFDQWAGIPFQQALEKRGLKQFKAVHHTNVLTSQMFQNFKDMMYDRRLKLYNWPIPAEEGKDYCDYIQELLELQAEMQSKYIIKVEAPQAEGKHDDYSDALMRMVWLATNHVGKSISFGGRSGPTSFNTSLPSNTTMVQARLRAKLGGSVMSRQPNHPIHRGGRGGGHR